MRKIIHITSIACCLVLLSSLSVLQAQKSVFGLELKETPVLPPMLIEIDEENIARSYNSRMVSSSTGYIDNEVTEEYVSSVFYEDPKINDAYNLFDTYLSGFENRQDESVCGRIKLDMLFYDYDYRFTFGSVFNVLTFGTGFLLGIPSSRETTLVEMRLEIYGPDQELLASYNGFGKSKALGGLYYKKKNVRFQNLEAMKEAITSINDQLLLNQEMLSGKLLASTSSVLQ